MTDAADRALTELDADREGGRGRWFEVLRIPSISAQPAHAADCRRAAEWFAAQLAGIGFSAEVRPTGGHPVVLAHHPGPKGGAGQRVPRLLYYGHYDVQPPEPLELWSSPPFEPVLVDGPRGKRAVARGAVDDKGQTMMWLEAFRAWHRAGGLPVAATVLIEGEEEISSVNLDPFIAANRDALSADAAVISDTGMWDIDTPAITTGLRGILYVQLDLKAASRDLHSGLYGGSALNPCKAIAVILGGLKDAEGHIQIPGFYDGVRDLSAARRRDWDALGFDEGAFLAGVGLSVPSGESGRSGLERLWARPTADVNGIWGGYTGVGSKTVIASDAHAKVSFRLVPGQDPRAVLAGFRAFVEARKPKDATVGVQVFGCSPAIEVSSDSRWVRAAQAALAAEYGKPAVLIGSGGSVPVVESLHRLLGLDTLLMGFGLNDDQVHSPNEKFELRCFEKGARSHVRLLAELAR